MSESNPTSVENELDALRERSAELIAEVESINRRIAELSDEEALTGDEEHRSAIVALGLQYSLLTQHTSFVAVDQVVRASNPDGTLTVDQSLPLPKGVSNLAVGEAAVPGTPEPATWALLAVASLCMAFAIRRQRRRSEARERGR